MIYWTSFGFHFYIHQEYCIFLFQSHGKKWSLGAGSFRNQGIKKQQQKQVQDLPTHLRNILGHKFHSNIFSYYSLNGSQS